MDLKKEWQNLQGLARFGQSTLDDAALPVHPKTLLKESLQASPNVPLGGSVSLQLDATCTADLALFRCAPEGDQRKDPDGVLKGKEGKDSQNPPPLITAPAKPGADCWLKYAIEGKLKQSVSLPLLSNLKLGFDVSQTLRFCDYRIHPKTAKLADCIGSDMGDGRFALTLEDIAKLKSFEAVSLRATATLAASVTLSWADVFTSTLGATGVLLGKAGGVGVKVDSGLTLSAKVEAKDDFRVAFAGVDDRQIRVAVSKAKTRGVSATGKLGVEAKLDFDEADAKKLLGDLFGETYAKLPSIAQSEASRGLYKLAKQKVSAAFTYEYSRISTESVLFQATLDRSTLTEELRLSFFRGDVGALLPSLKGDNPPLRLEQYLRRKTLAETRSWGFTLGIGPWKMYGKDHRDFTTEKSWTVDDRLKVAYVGIRSYETKELEWGTDYKADMAKFSAVPPPAEPLLSEFDFGFHLRMTRRAKIGDKTLSEWMDWALLWRILDEPQAASAKAGLLSALGGKSAEATFQITLGSKVTAKVLENGSAVPPYPDFPLALAAAMPWMAEYPERKDILTRRRCYTPVWEQVLGLPPRAGSSPAQRCADLKLFDDTQPTLLAFADLARSIDGNAPRGSETTILGRTAAFQVGMAALRKGASEPHDQVVPRAFKAMMGMGSQHFLLRALGVYLLDLAEEKGVLSTVVRSLLVQPSDTKDKQRWVYGNGGDPPASADA